MSREEMEQQHNLDIGSRISFLREILLNQGLTSLGEDSRVDLNTARDLDDTRNNCKCGSVISIGSFESLLDTVFAVFSEDKLKSYHEDNVLFTLADRYTDEIRLLKQLYPSTEDFIAKDIVGIGQFGEVRVVQEKHTGEIYAMKTIRKSQLFQLGPSVACFKEERDVMVRAQKNPWVVSLVYSFQDSRNLYLIMNFYAGGDLLNVLEQFDPMKESMARFYLSEISTAIHFVHEMGYIHRDVKPENVLVDVSGHIKLADFGSAAGLTEDGRIVGQIPFPVGTPEYVAPEVLSVLEHSGAKSCMYGRECDWWSLGVLAYEMLVGKTPFESGSRMETHANIQNYKTSLIFPETPQLCKEAVNLIVSLCTGIADRIGFYEITRHEFFNGIEWDDLLTTEPPYIPQVTGPDDVSNFDTCERNSMNSRHSGFELSTSRKKPVNTDNELCFVGYSYLPYPSNSVDELRVRECINSTPVAKPSQAWADVDELKNTLKHKERELDLSMEEKGLMEKESFLIKGQVQDLRHKLESERNERVTMEEHTLRLLEEVREGSRRVAEARESDIAHRLSRENDVVIKQLSQEKELSVQRARRLEQELKLKNGVWDEQANEVNELKKKLIQARVEANRSCEKFNKLAEEAHAHLMQKKNELEMKELALEEAQREIRLNQQKVSDTDKRLCHEIDLREAINSRLTYLNEKLQEKEEEIELYKLNEKEADDEVRSHQERERVQELEQELFDTTKTKEDLESSEFTKDTQIQQMEQELIEVLADKDHMQEELDILSGDMDLKEKEYVTQQAIVSQLEQELTAAKLQLQGYEEDVTSRLEYKLKSAMISSTHDDGAQSDSEVIMGVSDRSKEIKLHYSTQVTNIRTQLEKEMKEHAQAREKFSEHMRVVKKKMQELERSLEHHKSKFASSEENHKNTLSTLEKRNTDLQNQCNKSMGKVADMRRVQTSLEREIQQAKKQELYKEELRSKISSANLQEKIKQSDQEVTRLTTELTDVNKLNKDFQESVRSLQTELRNLRATSLRTESQLQQANQQIKADKLTLDNLRGTISSLEEVAPSVHEHSEKVKLQSQIEDLKSKLTQETQRLRISEQELQDTNRTLHRAQNLYQVEIDSWKKLHDEEGRKYIGYIEKNRELEDSLQKKEEEIHCLHRKEINIANQMLQLKQQLREANEKVGQDANKEHVNQLSQELAYEKASKEEAKIRLNELREVDEAQRLEIITLKKKMEDVLRSNSQLSSLRTEYRALKDAEIESSKQVNELKKEMENNWRVRQNFDRMKMELVELKDVLECKNDEALALQNNDSVQSNQIHNLEGNLQQELLICENLRDDVKTAQLELKETEQELSHLRTTTSKQELQSAQWAGEESKLNDVIASQKADTAKSQTELIRTRDEVIKLQMVVRQLEKGSLSEPERVLTLEDEIIGFKQRIQELEEVREKFNKSKLEAENHTRVVNVLREDNSNKEMSIVKLSEDMQGVEDRNKTLALQLDLQYQELQRAKDEATCAKLQISHLKATQHRLNSDLETANKQIVDNDYDEANYNREEKILKENEYRMETQLQQQAKLIDYLADGKTDPSKWSNKLKRKEMEIGKDKSKVVKQTQILYPPKTNGSDSGITSVGSDMDRITPTDLVSDIQQVTEETQHIPFTLEYVEDIEDTPMETQRNHGVFDKVKKTLSGRRFEPPKSSFMTGSRQLKSKSLKDVTVSRINSDKLSPTSIISTNTYSISSCSSEPETSFKRTKEIDESDPLTSPPKKICSEFLEPSRIVPKHFFSAKICKTGVVCDGCSLPIKFGERKEKCVFCRATVHPKCSSNYDSVSQCQSKLPPVVRQDTFNAVSSGPEPNCDWFRILIWPCIRQTWDKYFVILVEDSLLLYQQQPSIPERSKATRILNLGPYDKAIISVNSEYHRKRLGAFSNANYACTLAMFHQKTEQVSKDSLEGVYMQATSSEKKRLWIKILSGKINELERNRTKRPPFVMEPIYCAPYQVQHHFFSALSFVEYNFVILAGHSALYVMTMPTFVRPWSEPIVLEPSKLIAPIYSIRIFTELGLIIMVAGKERQIFSTLLEPMIEFVSGVIRDKKKTVPKFVLISNTIGCRLLEFGKFAEIPYMCSFHQDMRGTDNRIMIHYHQPANHSKCPLQLYEQHYMAQCTSILATPGKFFIGSHAIISYSPIKKLLRESQITMHNNDLDETRTLRNPIEILALPNEAEYLLVYPDMGVVISRRQGTGIHVQEEAVIWESTPTHAWTDENILFILSSRNVAVYNLVRGELPNNPTFYRFCTVGGHFLCYIPSNKSMLYTSTESESSLIFSCQFLFHNPIKRTSSIKEIKPTNSAKKRPQTTSLTDLPESVL